MVLSLFPLSSTSLLTSQANTLKPYLDAIRSTLTAAICLQNFSSQEVERHNKPEVESRSAPPPPSALILSHPFAVRAQSFY